MDSSIIAALIAATVVIGGAGLVWFADLEVATQSRLSPSAGLEKWMSERKRYAEDINDRITWLERQIMQKCFDEVD